MRLSSISIDGFGVFHDARLPEVPAGLVLIRGDNEAGKSTLLGFIRAILFGFPSKRSREPQYLPLDGGAHGGSLGIIMANGDEFTLERGAGPKGGQVTVNGLDGIGTNSEALSQILGNATAELYRNIYAFSLSELQTFDTLQADSVKSVIYGAIAGAAALSLPDAMKNIDKQLAGRFKPGGSNPTINVLLGRLEQTRKDRRNATGGVAEYDEASARLREAEKRIEELKRKLVRVNTQKGKAERHIECWNQWVDLINSEQELEQLPPAPDSFPENGLADLDALQAELKGKREHLLEREEERNVRGAEADDLKIDEALLARVEAVDVLRDGRATYAKALRDLPLEEGRREALEAKVADLFAQLGNDWAEERAQSIDRSVFTRESIVGFRDTLAARESDLLRTEQKLTDAQEQLGMAQGEATTAEENLQGFEISTEVVNEKTVGALKTGRDDFDKASHDLPGVEVELNGTRERLDESIKSISPQWTHEDVGNFDSSIAARKRIEDFDKSLSSAQQQVTESRTLLRAAEQSLSGQREAREMKVFRWLWIGFLALGPILFLGLFFASGPAAGLIAGGIALFVAVVFFAVDRIVQGVVQGNRTTAERAQQAIEESKGELEKREALLAEIRQQWEAHLHDLHLDVSMSPAMVDRIFEIVKTAKELIRSVGTAETRIEQMAATCKAYRLHAKGIPALAGLSDSEFLAGVDAFFERRRRDEELLKQRASAEIALKEKRKRVDEMQALLKQARQLRETAKQEKEEAERNWRGWTAGHGLPDLSPETALDALGILDKCIAHISERDALAREIGALEKEIADYQQEAASLLETLGRPIPPPERLAVAVDELAEELGKSKDANLLKAEKDRQITSIESQIAGVNAQITELENRQGEMFESIGAGDEKAFRETGRVHARGKEVREAISGTTRSLLAISGETDLDALREQLKATELDTLKAKQKQLDLDSKDLDDELDNLRNERSELNTSLTAMRGAGEIAELRAEEERLSAEIRDVADQWRKHAVAKWLLQLAREKFEKEQQPAVIRDTGEFFRKITAEQYTAVLAPIGEDSIEAVTPLGKRKKPEELSRGTAEQLYLAVRFGYIRHRARTCEPLPVVMDDILVNFDPTRARRAVETILALSNEHQLLYFTCHDETVNLFQSLDHNLPVIQLKHATFASSPSS